MTDTIKNTIDKFEAGYVFTANDFYMTVSHPKNVSKILNELVASGVLRKLMP